MEKKCKRCGEIKRIQKFKVDKRLADGRSACCRNCYENNKVGVRIRTAEQIESQRAKLKGRKYTLEHRLAISEGGKKAVLEGRHKFKKNENPHPQSARATMKYRMWKEDVKILRGNKCKDCGTEERLHCHHIQSYNDFPEKRFDPENGELLCIRCHMRHHRLNKGI